MKNRVKIGPESDSEWQRQRKTTKIASGAVSGRTFSCPGSFLVDFGVSAGAQNTIKTRPRKKLLWNFSARKSIFCVFFARVCSGSVLGRFWRLRGPSRTRFCYDFARFFWSVPSGSCRGLSGSAGRLPGYTVGLRNSLCGVSLGYGDLAERIK